MSATPPTTTVGQSTNIAWHAASVDRPARAQQRGHRSAILWFTGLSGAGKSTLANAVNGALFERGLACYVLDGDNVRHGLNRDLGFTDLDRTENIRRIAEVAKLMNDAGLIVITAFISPLRSDREMAKTIIGDQQYREVYVATAIEVCESRDPKGLYQKARQGLVKDFTGVSAPYETPTSPSLILDTASTSKEACVEALLKLILVS